jgi:hypothetical protein
MQFVKAKPAESQYATFPGARAKRLEVALGRTGFEPGRMAEVKAIPMPNSKQVGKHYASTYQHSRNSEDTCMSRL